MISKLCQKSIPSGDQKAVQLWSEYDETRKLRLITAQDRKQKPSDRFRASVFVKVTLMLFKSQ